jgi:hypothetical protein
MQTPPNLDPSTLQAYMILQQMLGASLQPLVDRFDRFEQRIDAKFDRMDDIYARKDVVDQRFKPLEESALTKYQRMGVLASAGFGLIMAFINIVSFITHLPH